MAARLMRTRAFALGLLLAISVPVLAATFNLFSPASGILVGNPSTYVTTAATSTNVRGLWSGTCDVTTFLRGDGACAAVPAGVVGANPTGSIGLTAVNGVATTYTRSDSTHALSQAILPTWTGSHNWNVVGGTKANAAIVVSSTFPALVLNDTDSSADARQWTIRGDSDGFAIAALTDNSITLRNAIAVSRTAGAVSEITLGNFTNDPVFTWGSDGQWNIGNPGVPGTSGQVLTSNGTGLSPTWQSVGGGGCVGANPTGTVGLTAVNGVAATCVRSDGAPALSQSIAPTWTAKHIFQTTGEAVVVQNDGALLSFRNTANTGILQLGTVNAWAGSGSTTEGALGAISTLNLYGTASTTPTMRITSTAITGLGPTAAVQVDMTPDRGTTTITMTVGCTVNSTIDMRWEKIGRMVVANFSNGANQFMSCTSNATTWSAIGTGAIPSAIRPTTAQTSFYVRTQDNSAATVRENGFCVITTAGDFICNRNQDAAAWTASGTKAVTFNSAAWAVN